MIKGLLPPDVTLDLDNGCNILFVHPPCNESPPLSLNQSCSLFLLLELLSREIAPDFSLNKDNSVNCFLVKFLLLVSSPILLNHNCCCLELSEFVSCSTHSPNGLDAGCCLSLLFVKFQLTNLAYSLLSQKPRKIIFKKVKELLNKGKSDDRVA